MGLCIEFVTNRGRTFDACMRYSTFHYSMSHHLRTRCQLGLTNLHYGRKAEYLYLLCEAHNFVPSLCSDETIVSARFC